MSTGNERGATIGFGLAIFHLTSGIWVSLATTVTAAGPTNQAWNVEAVGQIGGACSTVETSGSHAYVGEGPNVVILDVSDPSHPAQVGRIMLPGTVQHVAVSGNLACAALEGNLHFLDVANPAAPRLVGSYATASSLVVGFLGNLAYTLSGWGTQWQLEIIDVADPAAPRRLGVWGQLYGYPDLYVSEGLAYITSMSDGLVIVDISNPSSLTVRSSYPDLQRGSRMHVHAANGLAYVVDEKLHIIDVSDPTSPTLLGRLAPPRGLGGPFFVSDGLAYVLNGHMQFHIIDVGNPRSPFLRGSYDLQNPVADVYVSGTRAYFASANMLIFDVSNPDSPAPLGEWDAPDGGNGVCAADGLIYLADGWTGLRIIDVSNPAMPVLRASYDTPGFLSQDVAVSGSMAYLACFDGGLQIVDVTDPDAPSLRGSFIPAGLSGRVTASDGLAFLFGSYLAVPSLFLLDVADPTSPVLRATLWAGVPYSCYYSKNQLYVAYGESGLCIYDVTKRDEPTTQGSFDTPGVAKDVYVSGGLAYVADGQAGLQILDVSDPANPTFRGSYDTPGDACCVVVSGALAYILYYGGSVRIVDVSNPTMPRLRG